MNLKQSILILSIAALLTGCGGDSTPVVDSALMVSLKAVQKGQVTDNITGESIADVKVSIGDIITTTDTEGYYTLTDLTETDETTIHFEKEGYLLGSRVIQIKRLAEDNRLSDNYLEFSMRANQYKWSFESSKEIITTNILINTSYIDIYGNPYIGIISAELTMLDITSDEGKTDFTGSFKGIDSNGDIVQFESFGFISIFLKDSEGNALRIADGETGTLIFDNFSSSENLDTIPLWYYDYNQGLWIEEGYAELQENGTYRGEISRLGIWSLNKSLEEDPGIYRSRIIDENGVPIRNVRVYAIGENWISSDLIIDENGIFELNVIPGDNFELTAYNYQDKYSASYNNTIFAITSGDVVQH